MKNFEKIYNKIILEEFNSEMIKHIHNAEKTQLSEGIQNICSKEISITTPKLIIKEYLRAKINSNTDLNIEQLQNLIRNIKNSCKEFNCDLTSVNKSIQYNILFKEFAESDNLDEAKDILARAGYLNRPESISYYITNIINTLFFNKKKNYISDNINFDKIKKVILNFPYLNKFKYGWLNKNDNNLKKEFDKCINELKKIILPVYDKFFKTLFNETFEDILNYTASVEPDFLSSYYLDKYFANLDNQVDKCIARILFELSDNLHNIHGANMNNIETLKNKNLNVSVQPIIREILAELDASNVKDEDLLILSANDMSKYKNSKDLKIKYPLALFLNDLGEVKYILQFTNGYFNKNLSKYLYSLRDNSGFYNLVNLNDNNHNTSATAAFNDSNVTTLVAFPADILKKSIDKRQKRYQDAPFKTRENFDKYQKEQFANRLKVFKDTKNSRKLEEQITQFINEIPNTLNGIKERLNNVNLIQADSNKQRLISYISNYLSEIIALNERIKSNFESAKSNGSAVINNYWLSRIDDTADTINEYKNIIIDTLDKLES